VTTDKLQQTVTDDRSYGNVFVNLMVNNNFKNLDRVRILVLYVICCCCLEFKLF
jgi:hypothetical protein